MYFEKKHFQEAPQKMSLNKKMVFVGSCKYGLFYKLRPFVVGKLVHFDFLQCSCNLKVGDCGEESLFAVVFQANY